MLRDANRDEDRDARRDRRRDRRRDLGAALVVARVTARRASRSGALWGALFGALVANEALGYRRNFPTTASREEFARSFGGNSGLAAVIGPGRALDTIEGFVAWRMFGLLIIVGAVWGMLTATRLLRAEEDAGRWELLLAGRTTRRHATLQAMTGLGVGFATLWALTAACIAAAGTRPGVGFSVGASLFYATAATASAGMFLAVGALTSQLAPTRRQANGLAAAVLAVSFLTRLVADAGVGLEWLRWAGPLGWVENLRPLTDPQPLALVPVVVFVAATAGAALVLAGRRDVGVAAIGRGAPPRARTWLLGSSSGLAVRLERWVVAAWVAGLAVLALVFGVVARAAADADLDDAAVQQAIGRLGGDGSGAAAAWIGYEFLFVTALVAYAAAIQISALRGEEAAGHLDHLLARRVSRAGWLAGRVGLAAGVVVVAGLAAGAGGWAGLASGSGGGDVGAAAMLRAGVNVMPPALFVLGLGTLLFGLVPRLAAPVLYGLVAWSFAVQVIGSTLTTNRWLLDTALFSHLGPVPAADLDGVAVAWLTGLGVLAALAGLAAFRRRDLATS
jgi:ABC-2 type transport system permease protein